ncbi:ORF6N domain-containing protein [Salmonella enterica subsp. enterica serovar Grumpensis]|nr:ORF6N domain-containing protein [Salmonella enterica subsp. enterica serovar Grumpensis]
MNTITAETLSPIPRNQIPVITTELLAHLYGADIKNIQNNFARNMDRFEVGKHFFKIEGEELRELKHRPSLSGSVKIARNVRSLILWTERGAARHAKMLETDQAWDVFEKLEDCYFSQNCPSVEQKPIVTGDGRTLVIRFDEHGNIISTQKVPKNAWVCTIEDFKFFLEKQGWTLINRNKIKSMTVGQLLSLK